MLCVFESTGILEQNLAAYRAVSSGQRQNSTPATLKTILKVLLDVDDVVKFNDRDQTYSLTKFGMDAFNLYRTMFGAGKNVAQHNLPQRTTRRFLSATGLAAFTRLQSEQKKTTTAAVVSEDEARHLKRLVEESTDLRATKKQRTMSEMLANKVATKVSLLSPDAFAADGRAKLEKLLAEEKSRVSKLSDMQVRDLDSSEPMDASGGVAVCVISKGEVSNANDIIKACAKQLHRLGGLKVLHLTSSNLVARILEAKFVVWVATSKEAEASLIVQGKECQTGPLDVSSILCRLLGGYVAGPAWLQKSSSRGRLLKPVLQLTASANTELQVGFDATVPTRETILRLLAAIESHPKGYRKWVIRANRSDLPRA